MSSDLRPLDPSRCYRPGRCCQRREAFTIVELLVVLAVMATLAAMIAFAFGPLQDRNAVNGGAALLQTWLNTARQRAIRDKVPSGIRFLAGTTLPAQSPTPNAFYVTQMVYLEGGVEIFGTLYGSAGSTNLTTTGPLPSPPLTTADYVIINDGLPRAIGTAAAAAGGTSITLAAPLPYTIPQASALPFRIIRGPNVVTSGNDSDNILQMPRGSCVNFDPQTTQTTLYPGGMDLGNYALNANTSINYIPKGSFSSANGVDLMFAPDGTVSSPSTNYPIAFFVSSTSAVSPQTSGVGFTANTPLIESMRGNPALVVVYPRTGQVVSVAVGLDTIPVPANGANKANVMKDIP